MGCIVLAKNLFFSSKLGKTKTIKQSTYSNLETLYKLTYESIMATECYGIRDVTRGMQSGNQINLFYRVEVEVIENVLNNGGNQKLE